MKKYIYIALVVLGSSAFLGCNSEKKKEIVFVENNKLFTEFEMSKELFGGLESLANNRKMILDSLKLELELNSKLLQSKGEQVSDVEVKDFEMKRNNYLVKEKTFIEEQNRLQDTYNKQVWDRLNTLVSEYGKEKEYSFIFGGNGDGSLMFSAEGNNVTEELIKYCNSKYDGLPK